MAEEDQTNRPPRTWVGFRITTQALPTGAKRRSAKRPGPCWGQPRASVAKAPRACAGGAASGDSTFQETEGHGWVSAASLRASVSTSGMGNWRRRVRVPPRVRGVPHHVVRASATPTPHENHSNRLATQEVQVLLALVSGRWTRDGLNPPEVLTDRSFVDLTGRGLLLGLFGGIP